MHKFRKGIAGSLCILVMVACATLTSPYTAPVEKVKKEESVSTLVIENVTPYEIQNLYIASADGREWSENVLEFNPISPDSASELKLPGGVYTLKAEIWVGNQFYTVEEQIDFYPGKKYLWQIDNTLWTDFSESYAYLDSYSYLGGYGYLGNYAYLEF